MRSLMSMKALKSAKVRQAGLAPTRRRALGALSLLAALPAWALPPAVAKGPQRNLVVELRSVPADEADRDGDAAPAQGGFQLGTSRPESAPLYERLLVRNGEWGSLRIGRDLPVLWTRAASVRSAAASGAASGATGATGSSGAAVVNELSWFHAGQGLAVQPRWPGGDHAVTLQLRFDGGAVEADPAGALPSQRRVQASTTLLLPLGRWTTFASTGRAAPARSGQTWSTQAAPADAPQALQLRVRLP